MPTTFCGKQIETADEEVDVGLVHDNVWVTYARSALSTTEDYANFDRVTASTQVVLHVEAGQQVYAMTKSSHNYLYDCQNCSTFSGALISAD